jgi:hypothetical protein
VAAGLRARHPASVAYALTDWERGNFLGQDDATILQQAALQKLTLVTYDRRTIPPMLKRWAEEGQSHGGVIFVDEKTISPADIGALVKALGILWKQGSAWNWKDRVCFLRR